MYDRIPIYMGDIILYLFIIFIPTCVILIPLYYLRSYHEMLNLLFFIILVTMVLINIGAISVLLGWNLDQSTFK